MACFVTAIASSLPPERAFAFMADFTNARAWDPSVSRAQRLDEGPIRVGSRFDLVARFARRDVQLRYEIVEWDAPRTVVLEGRAPGLVSKDMITVAPSDQGSVVRLTRCSISPDSSSMSEPMTRRMFTRVGADAEQAMRKALNP